MFRQCVTEFVGSTLPASGSDLRSAAPRIIDLPGGSQIAIAEYGDPDGVPVFFCHGWPASRLQGGLLHEYACEFGARIIAPDRPGVGHSPAQPGRTVADWPKLLEALADKLGIGEFRVLGVSGGGPYALGAAWGLPHRVPVVSVVCSAPPLADRSDIHHLNPAYRWLLRTHRVRPSVLRWLFRAARPVAQLRPPPWMRAWMLRQLPRPEAETLADPEIFEACFHNYRECWRGGADGLYSDGAVFAEPWGFPLNEVRVPVRLWHGKQDANFAWQLAQEMVTQLPNCKARFLDEEAHYSLAIRHRRAILEDLLAYKVKANVQEASPTF